MVIMYKVLSPSYWFRTIMLDLVADSQREFSYIGDKTAAFLATERLTVHQQ